MYNNASDSDRSFGTTKLRKIDVCLGTDPSGACEISFIDKFYLE
jgi:hypothetical protein